MHEKYEFVIEKGEKNPCDIQVYALSTCGFCKRGLEFLRKNNLAFRYIYVDQLKPDERMKIKRDLSDKFEERLGFPFVVIDGGDKVLVGFQEEKWKTQFLEA
jgi:glutaredoxin-like protein NrdH